MNSNNLVQHSLTGQHYGYSAADMGDLGAPSYTLCTIAVDESGSVSSFKKEIEVCIQEVVKACKFSPRADYLLIRLVAFQRSMREIHGFKQLCDCDINDYDDCIKPGGTTLLFETARNAITATKDYGKQLSDNDFEANAIVFIITDGMDNESGTIDAQAVGDVLKETIREESLESIQTILVGVGIGDYAGVSAYLDKFKDEAGLNQYVEIKDANDKSIAKLTGFISQSISSQSNSLGSGAMSQPLTF